MKFQCETTGRTRTVTNYGPTEVRFIDYNNTVKTIKTKSWREWLRQYKAKFIGV